jgi:hypothetical protein
VHQKIPYSENGFSPPQAPPEAEPAAGEENFGSFSGFKARFLHIETTIRHTKHLS